MSDLQLFTSLGTLRDDISPEEIADLSDERQAQLAVVITAAVAGREAEEAKQLALQAHRAAVKEENEAAIAFNKCFPALTHVEIHRQSVAVQLALKLGKPVPCFDDPDRPAAKDGLDAVTAKVAECRQALNKAEHKLRETRREFEQAILMWQGETKPDSAAVYRDHLKRLAEHKANGNVKIEKPAVVPSVLDAVLSGGGRATSINQRHVGRAAYARRVRG